LFALLSGSVVDTVGVARAASRRISACRLGVFAGGRHDLVLMGMTVEEFSAVRPFFPV